LRDATPDASAASRSHDRASDRRLHPDLVDADEIAGGQRIARSIIARPIIDTHAIDHPGEWMSGHAQLVDADRRDRGIHHRRRR
jgi:hypothetical protein